MRHFCFAPSVIMKDEVRNFAACLSLSCKLSKVQSFDPKLLQSSWNNRGNVSVRRSEVNRANVKQAEASLHNRLSTWISIVHFELSESQTKTKRSHRKTRTSSTPIRDSCAAWRNATQIFVGNNKISLFVGLRDRIRIELVMRCLTTSRSQFSV